MQLIRVFACKPFDTVTQVRLHRARIGFPVKETLAPPDLPLIASSCTILALCTQRRPAAMLGDGQDIFSLLRMDTGPHPQQNLYAQNTKMSLSHYTLVKTPSILLMQLRTPLFFGKRSFSRPISYIDQHQRTQIASWQALSNHL